MMKTVFDLTINELIKPVAYQGYAEVEYRRAIDEIHQLMRKNYQEMIYYSKKIYDLSLKYKTMKMSGEDE